MADTIPLLEPGGMAAWRVAKTAETVSIALQISSAESAKRQADALERIAGLLADAISPYDCGDQGFVRVKQL